MHLSFVFYPRFSVAIGPDWLRLQMRMGGIAGSEVEHEKNVADWPALSAIEQRVFRSLGHHAGALFARRNVGLQGGLLRRAVPDSS